MSDYLTGLLLVVQDSVNQSVQIASSTAGQVGSISRGDQERYPGVSVRLPL